MFIANIVPTVDFTISPTDVFVVGGGLISAILFFYKTKTKIETETEKRKELKDLVDARHIECKTELETLFKRVDLIEREGTLSFKAFERAYSKDVTVNDTRMKKLEDIYRIVEKLGFETEYIKKWIDRQEEKADRQDKRIDRQDRRVDRQDLRIDEQTNGIIGH